MLGTIAIIIFATVVLTGLGGGGAYLLWLKTRPQKELWKANIFQLSQGVRKPLLKNGKVISDLPLKDLIPYGQDIVERVDKEPGITLYRLQKMNKKVPAITHDVVEFWGPKNKSVNVLYHDGTCTLMKKGYDERVGTEIFTPLSHDRTEMIKGEILLRKDRLRKEKDILQAISPWIVAGIIMIGLVAMSYVNGMAHVKTSENYEEGAKAIASSITDLKGVLSPSQSVTTQNNSLGRQEAPPPPSIE